MAFFTGFCVFVFYNHNILCCLMHFAVYVIFVLPLCLKAHLGVPYNINIISVKSDPYFVMGRVSCFK